jgi:hypothetical protein
MTVGSSPSSYAERAAFVEQWFMAEQAKHLPPLDEGSLIEYLIAGGACDYHSAQKRWTEECQGCLSALRTAKLILRAKGA